MTSLLKHALLRVEALSSEEQDGVAAQILETLDGEDAWMQNLQDQPELMQSLTEEALTAHLHAETSASKYFGFGSADTENNES